MSEEELLVATRLLIEAIDKASPPDLTTVATVLRNVSHDYALPASQRRLCEIFAKLLKREAKR